jgi:hypothetical protein
MGGAVKQTVEKVGQELKIVKKPPAPAPAPVSVSAPQTAQAAAAPQAPLIKSAVATVEEDKAARRRARRGARALLSEQRLLPETGLGQSTLGAGQM